MQPLRHTASPLSRPATGAALLAAGLLGLPGSAAAYTEARIDAGDHHTVACHSEQRNYAWGANDHGQLGDGTTTDRRLPVLMHDDRQAPPVLATDIAVGGSHGITWDAGGRALTWGANDHGQLGDGTTAERPTIRYVVDEGGYPYGGGETNMAAGGRHTLDYGRRFDLDTKVRLLAWGANDRGQLGDGTTVERHHPVPVFYEDGAPVYLTHIAAGRDHSLFIPGDGTVWGFGANERGQLGDGSTTDRTRPVPVRHRDGTPLEWMSNISGGNTHSVAVGFGGLWAWGANDRGQLGNPGNDDSPYPVAVLRRDGTPLTPAFYSDKTHTSIAAGGDHTLVLDVYNGLWAWGANERGQLGDGTTVDRPYAVKVRYADGTPVTDVMSVSAGQQHSVALLGSGEVLTWGANDRGQLGDGTKVDRHRPVKVVDPATGEPLNLQSRDHTLGEQGPSVIAAVYTPDGHQRSTGVLNVGSVFQPGCQLDSKDQAGGLLAEWWLSLTTPNGRTYHYNGKRWGRRPAPFRAGPIVTATYKVDVPLERFSPGLYVFECGADFHVDGRKETRFLFADWAYLLIVEP